MTLRERFTDAMKTAMKAGDQATLSTVRMILARLKEVDIAARPKGIAQVPDEEVMAMLRSMVKSRRESVDLYRQGNRPDLVEKEEAEIRVIEGFLPQALAGEALAQAVAAAIAETGAASVKEMGKVMALLRGKYPGQLDMAAAGAAVKAKLGG